MGTHDQGNARLARSHSEREADRARRRPDGRRNRLWPLPGGSDGRRLPVSRPALAARPDHRRSEEHTSELQSLMRFSYAVFCLKKKTYFTAQMSKRQLTPYGMK